MEKWNWKTCLLQKILKSLPSFRTTHIPCELPEDPSYTWMCEQNCVSLTGVDGDGVGWDHMFSIIWFKQCSANMRVCKKFKETCTMQKPCMDPKTVLHQNQHVFQFHFSTRPLNLHLRSRWMDGWKNETAKNSYSFLF